MGNRISKTMSSLNQASCSSNMNEAKTSLVHNSATHGDYEDKI